MLWRSFTCLSAMCLLVLKLINLCVCAHLLNFKGENTMKKKDKMAQKICSHLKTIKTSTKCPSDAEGKVATDRLCGCESWCERSDSCELEGHVRDQWVSRWFCVGL